MQIEEYAARFNRCERASEMGCERKRDGDKTRVRTKKRIHFKIYTYIYTGSGMRKMPQMDEIKQVIRVDVTTYSGNISSK